MFKKIEEILNTDYQFYFERNSFFLPVTSAFKSFTCDMDQSGLMENFSSCVAHFNDGFVYVFLPKNEIEQLNRIGVERVLDNRNIVPKVDRELREVVSGLIALSELFETEDFSKYSNLELSKLIKKYEDLFRRNIIYGYSQVFVEHGISDYFIKKVRGKVDDKNVEEIVSIVIAPEYQSYSLREELEFLNLLITITNKQEFIKGSEIDSDLKTRFSVHSKKWGGFWANFSGKIKNTDDFINDAKIYLGSFDPKEQFTLKQNALNQLDERKRKYLELFKDDEEVLYFIDILRKFSELKDYRRSNISLSQYKIKRLLNEAAVRLKVSVEDLYLLDAVEIVFSIENQKINKQTIEDRKKECAALFTDGQMEFIEDSEKVVERMKQLKEKYFKGKEIKGFCACKGNYKGRVKIINDARDIHKIEQGDVLVSKMTTPDILIAIKKSGAIITDEGGLTCHAAIVSREFGIPCIIATKIATKILKDGDIVEVDA